MKRPSRDDYHCTFDRFRLDTNFHQLTVAMDDGLNRHLKFRAPLTIFNWFDLITVPGLLVINGDFGCYAFSRVKDMFEFFRHGERGIEINRSYWAEKLVSATREQVTEFDAELLWSGLVEQLRTHGIRDRLTKFAALRELIEASRDWGLDEHECFRRLSELDGDWPEMCDLPSHRRYTFHFEWCLWAIVWGISVYDEHKSREKAA